MTNKAPSPAADDTASNVDPMAKLLGDWSWRPEMQVEDPGYVYSERERERWELYAAYTGKRNEGCKREHSGSACVPDVYGDPKYCLACDDDKGGYTLGLPALRPWTVKAHVGPVAPPKRIGG